MRYPTAAVEMEGLTKPCDAEETHPDPGLVLLEPISLHTCRLLKVLPVNTSAEPRNACSMRVLRACRNVSEKLLSGITIGGVSRPCGSPEANTCENSIHNVASIMVGVRWLQVRIGVSIILTRLLSDCALHNAAIVRMFLAR